MTLEQVKQILAARVRAAGTAKNWADANDIAPSYVSDVLRGRKEPGERILTALGIERTYVRIRN